MTERRIAAFAITVFSAALIASGVLLGDAFGALGDSDYAFVEHYASPGRRAGDIAGGVAMIVAGGAFLVFVPALRAALGRGGVALDVFSQAGAAFAVLLVVGATMFVTTPLALSFGGLFDDTGQFDGGHKSVLPQAATVLVLVAAFPVGSLSVAMLAIASQRGDVLPKWHMRLGLVCAAVMPLAFFFVPILALPLWSCATAIALFRRAPASR